VLERVLIDETIAGFCELAGKFGRSTRAWSTHQSRRALVRKAMAPLAHGGRGQLKRVGDGLEALPLDDVAHGLGTAKDTGVLGLLEERVERRKGVIGKVQLESLHTGGLHHKLLQQYTHPTSHYGLTLVSPQSLFASKFPEAVYDFANSILVGLRPSRLYAVADPP
jgi:hypothetical protein